MTISSYARYFFYVGLLMDLFLVATILFHERSVASGMVALYGYGLLAGRAYVFLLGTIFKSLRSDRMLLYGMEFSGAGALAASYGNRTVGVLLICAAFVFQWIWDRNRTCIEAENRGHP